MEVCAALAPESCTLPSSGGLEGRVIGGRYRIGEVLGTGAMGRVFTAEHVDLGRRCAVKVIRDAHGTPDAGAREEAVARFCTEALAAARMDHPNVLRVLDFGRETDGLHYLVTEHLDGADLVDLMAQEERIGMKRAIRIVRQICSALQHAHDRGVVHRDIKPENVRVVRREGDDGKTQEVVKLLDFGTAFLVDGTAPSGRIVIGTPAYMSPEQASGDPVDSRADLYAVGVLLFELATGRLPFERSSAVALAAAHIECPPPAPSSIDERVSPELERIILACLQKEPSGRPQSARELRDALDRWLLECGQDYDARFAAPEIEVEIEVPVSHRAPRLARLFRLRPRTIAALAAAALGAAAAIALRVAGPGTVEDAAAAEVPRAAAVATATPERATPVVVTARAEPADSSSSAQAARPLPGRVGARSPPLQGAYVPKQAAAKPPPASGEPQDLGGTPTPATPAVENNAAPRAVESSDPQAQDVPSQATRPIEAVPETKSSSETGSRTYAPEGI